MLKNANLRKLFVNIMTNQAYSGMTAAALLTRFPKLKAWEKGVPEEQVRIILRKVADIIFTNLNRIPQPKEDLLSDYADNQKDSKIVSKQFSATKTFSVEYFSNKETEDSEANLIIRADLGDEEETIPFESLVDAINSLIDGIIASRNIFRQPV